MKMQQSLQWNLELNLEFIVIKMKLCMIDPRVLKLNQIPPYAKDRENNKVDYSHGNNIKDFAVDVDCAKTDNHGIYRK